MLFVFIFTVLYVVIFLVDIFPLKKQKKKKEFTIVTIFVSLIYVLQIMEVLGVTLPGPTKSARLLVKLFKRLVGRK